MEDRQREYEPLLFSLNSVGLQRLLDKNWGLFQETGMSHSVAGWVGSHFGGMQVGFLR